MQNWLGNKIKNHQVKRMAGEYRLGQAAHLALAKE